MLKIKVTEAFKQDYNELGEKTAQLVHDVAQKIAGGEDVGAHDLKDKYEGLKECLVKKGLPLLYKLGDENVTLVRVGKGKKFVKPEAPKEVAPGVVQVGDDGETKVFAVSMRVEAEAEGAKTPGKYQVFPEAHMFKYRLKANNGEILIVSYGYLTRDGAKAGIETLKKNVENGVARITVDKKGFAQFRISTANDGRIVALGEIYPKLQGAISALNSVKRFYNNSPIIDLDEIPNKEVREWELDNLPAVEANDNGKIEIYLDPQKKLRARLIASNGEPLLVTESYASASALKNGLETIKKQVLAGSASVARDKQNRYQFRIYSTRKAVLALGETYSSRDGAESALISVRNFIEQAKVVDLSK